MVLSGALVATVFRRVGPTAVVPLGLLGIGVLVMSLSAVGAVWQLVALMFLVGWMITPLQAAVTTLVQTSVAPGERGRALAFLGAVSSVGNIASMAVAGVVADVVGVRAVFAGAGAVSVAAAGLAAWLYRRAREAAVPAPPSGPVAARVT